MRSYAKRRGRRAPPGQACALRSAERQAQKGCPVTPRAWATTRGCGGNAAKQHHRENDGLHRLKPKALVWPMDCLCAAAVLRGVRRMTSSRLNSSNLNAFGAALRDQHADAPRPATHCSESDPSNFANAPSRPGCRSRSAGSRHRRRACRRGWSRRGPCAPCRPRPGSRQPARTAGLLTPPPQLLAHARTLAEPAAATQGGGRPR